MKRTQIGLFFGSFNPIHIGHMALANYILEFANLKEIWFVISPHNPLKNRTTLLADHHRLEMVNIAVDDYYEKYKASNVEFNLPKPSYTIDTLTYLNEKYPQKEFAIIMGMDNLETIDKWKNYELLLEKYKLIVYPRSGFTGGTFANHPNVTIINAPMLELSSTMIRDAIKEGKKLPYLLPPKVFEFIQDMRFYK